MHTRSYTLTRRDTHTDTGNPNTASHINWDFMNLISCGYTCILHGLLPIHLKSNQTKKCIPPVDPAFLEALQPPAELHLSKLPILELAFNLRPGDNRSNKQAGKQSLLGLYVVCVVLFTPESPLYCQAVLCYLKTVLLLLQEKFVAYNFLEVWGIGAGRMKGEGCGGWGEEGQSTACSLLQYLASCRLSVRSECFFFLYLNVFAFIIPKATSTIPSHTFPLNAD